MPGKKRSRRAFEIALERTGPPETSAGSDVVRPEATELREKKKAAFRQALEFAKRNERDS